MFTSRVHAALVCPAPWRRLTSMLGKSTLHRLTRRTVLRTPPGNCRGLSSSATYQSSHSRTSTTTCRRRDIHLDFSGDAAMPQSQWMNITFLGTSGGSGPSETRNCSSLVLDVVGDGSLWMVDCAEGTLRQFALQPNHPGARLLKLTKLTNIFVTHMHADHVMGIPTLLRNILGFPNSNGGPSQSKTPRVNIYGPAGLRTFVRTILKLTCTHPAEAYVVHELLRPGDATTPCEPADVLHDKELPGRDILCDADGFWRDFASGRSSRGTVAVQAGPIVHRDPCIGYVFHEPADAQARKIVVLGDTHDAGALTPLLAATPGRVALLVHEATDAYIDPGIDPTAAVKQTPARVAARTEEHGHSTPVQAGVCAGRWDAERLVLNHFGWRFPAPWRASAPGKNQRSRVLCEVERQASEAWQMTPSVLPPATAALVSVEGAPRRKAIAGYDYLRISVPPPPRDDAAGTRN